MIAVQIEEIGAVNLVVDLATDLCLGLRDEFARVDPDECTARDGTLGFDTYASAASWDDPITHPIPCGES